MATMKDIKKGFCDDVYTGLSEMKEKILTMRDNLALTGAESDDIFAKYDRHLRDLIDQIDWKLQILAQACPYDWKGSSEYAENLFSVNPIDNEQVPELSAGDVGG